MKSENERRTMPRAVSPALQQQIVAARQKRQRRQAQNFQPPRLVEPLIIVSAPRAGSTLLLETLAHFPHLWTLGEESHEIVEGIPEFHPSARGYASNRLTAADLTPPLAEALCDRFGRQLRDRSGRLWMDMPTDAQPRAVRMLEKTPKNALRIPFLQALFPDARFLFLHRAPAENIASMLEGWQSGRFVAYPALPGWRHQSCGRAWSFLLIPGWEDLVGQPLAAVAAQQWRIANQTILDDLIDHGAGTRLWAPGMAPRWLAVSYTDLVQTPRQTVERIAAFAGLDWDDEVEHALASPLPWSRMTFSAPAPDKWQNYTAEIAPLLPSLEPLAARLAQMRA